MNGISHRQAIKLIDQRLDGLLKESQLLLLEEHLRSCDSCRAYAAQMDLLPARLQNEFHARWDERPGASQKIIEHVTTKARKFPMGKRISSGLKLVAGAAALVVAALFINLVLSQIQNVSTAASEGVEQKPTPEPTQISSPDGLVAFVSIQNGNSEIHTMHTDGSGVTNLTNSPAEDHDPVWSPDGRRIAFVSERDGNENIYVMNGDGNDLIRLTEDPASDMIPVWSPDGTKIAYTSQDPNENISSIYIVDSTGQNRRRLSDDVPGPVLVWPEAWSPDGQYFFFHINRQILKVNVSSGETTPMTPQEDIPSQFVLTKDGSKLSYLDLCTQNPSGFCNRVKTVQEDGTGAEEMATLQLQQVCKSEDPSSTNGTNHYELIKWSPDRTKILFAFYCEENGGLFYIANADGSEFKPLTDYPILYESSGFDWSPDSQFVIFSSALDNAQSDTPYLLDIPATLQNPSLRPTPLNTSAAQISFFAWQPLP